LASDVAGGIILDGARQFVEGRRPSLNDLLLTPANAFKVMHQLAHLRGAAMKVGQLLSMDAGDLLPRELA
ncbi:AarF/ABC1/UbiB kinase family protein, partial [Vibrio parahaemolyticus]